MRSGLARSALALLLACVTAVVVVPMLVLLRTSWVEGRGRLAEVITDPDFGSAVANSFGLSAAVTGLAVPVGVAIALALRDPRLPGRDFWRAAVLLPVLVPDFVLAYSWLRAYARAGLTSEVFGFAWPQVQGPVGVTVIVASQAVPLVYLVTVVGLSTRAEPATERAGRASGAGPATVLRTITLPLLGPAIATAAVLIFVLTLGTFAVPQVIGAPAGFSTITTRIYADLALGSNPQSFVDAITLAVLLMVITLIVVTPADRLLGGRLSLSRTSARDSDWGTGSRTPRILVPILLGLYLIFTCGLPLAGAGQRGVHPRGGRRAVAGKLDPRQLPRRSHSAYRGGARSQPAPCRGRRIHPAAAWGVHGGIEPHAQRARGERPGRPHPGAAGISAGDRLADRLRPLARRYGVDHPARLPGQALGLGAPSHFRRGGSVGAGGTAGCPGQRCQLTDCARHRRRYRSCARR